MQNLQKKIKSFINTSIGISALFALLGIIFLIFPEESLNTIRWIFCIIALVSGFYLIAIDFSRKIYMPFFNTSAAGAILVVLGIVFALYPNIMNIFPVLLGAWFVINAISSIRFSMALQGSTSFNLAISMAILSLICGILLLINPWGGQISMMMFVGVMLLIYSVSNIADMIVLKRNLAELGKNLKKMMGKVIE